MFSKKDAVSTARKQEQEFEAKHARLASLHAEASAEQRQADEDVRAADVESGSFKALVSARRLVADRAAEIDARLTQVAQELASAKAATVAAVEADAAQKAAAEAAACLFEKTQLEAEMTAKTIAFVTFLAKGIARVKELDAGRSPDIAPTLWAGAQHGKELLFAARIPELEDRSGKVHALGNMSNAKAIAYAVGESGW